MAGLRVTGGVLRGQPLFAPKRGIRPTTGMVREAIFSLLGDVSGLRVLDLFCGTGALGIEALSRGAAEAVFVDRNAGPVMRNLEQLGIADPGSGWGWAVRRSDVLDFLEGRGSPGPELTADLVLCDPPYRLAPGFATGLDIRIPAVLREAGRVVVETAERSPLELSLPLLKQRTYGDTRVQLYGANERS